MPAFSTHYIFFNELKNDLRKQSNFKFNDEACSIGTQGPDIFFFTFSPSKRKVGVQLHHSFPSEILDAFKEYLNFSTDVDIAKSYIYGFILHYSLDRICHPYVYAHQELMTSHNKKMNPSTAHNTIEFAIDTYLIHEFFGINDPREFDTSGKISGSERVINEISHLLSFLIQKTTNSFVDEKIIKKILIKAPKNQKILQNRKNKTKILGKFLDIPSSLFLNNFKISSVLKPNSFEKSINYANINHRTWRSPYEIEIDRNESFIELFESSKYDALNLINGFNSLINDDKNSYEVTHNISFLTGIEMEANNEINS